ncbi:MAG: hypothetical protein IT178_14750 [Acidobacteria bacterium]|nr:hypothetical protein [Acidobacteriota bacterium]
MTVQPELSHPLRELLRPVLEAKWYVLVFCASTVVSSLALTYLYSEKYTAATTIVFRPQEVTRLRQKESMAFGAPLPTAPFDLIYDNLQLLVKSEPVMLAVIDDLNLDAEEPRVYSGPPLVQWFNRTKDWIKDLRDNTWTVLKFGRVVRDNPRTAALKGLREHLNLTNHNSYVFYLSFTDKYPARAARIVDAVADKVVNAVLAEQQDPGAQRLRQLRTLREHKMAEIERYQQEIQTLLSRNGIASVEHETERAVARYSDLTLEKIKLDSIVASTQAKLAALERKGGVGVGKAAPGSLQPEDFRRLKSERVFTEIDLRAQQQQQATLSAALVGLERRLTSLPLVQHQYDSLIQNLRTAQRDLVQISDPYHEAEVQASDVLSTVVVAHKARVPAIPVSPIKVYHVALAGGLAICISFGLAYLFAFARSDQMAQFVHRTVSNVVGMWDGVERRRQRDRRGNGASADYSGPERRGTGGRRAEDSPPA